MKEANRFYSSLGLLVLLNIIIKPVWIFGIDRQVQNIAGEAAYGTYFSLLNFSIVFSFLLDWGFTAYFNRQLASRTKDFTAHIGTFFLYKLILSVLYAFIVLGIAWLSGINKWSILISVVIIQVLTSIFIFLRSIITALQWFRLDAWFSVLDKGLMIIICGGFLLFPQALSVLSIEKFLHIQIACTLVAVVSAIIVLYANKINFKTSAFVVTREVFRDMLPFAMIVLLMSAHYRLDGFLLERIHTDGAAQAGIYAAAFRLLDAANMVGYLFAAFLLPFVARHTNNRTMIAAVTLTTRHVLIVFSVGVTITVLFLGGWLQEILYHTDSRENLVVLQWCLPALIGYSLVHIYGTVLTATGRLTDFCLIVLLSLVLNIFLNIILIPGWGAKGCCIAAIVSQSICGLITMIVATKKTGLDIHFLSILKYLFITAILVGYFYIVNQVSQHEWLQIAGAVFLTLLSALFTGLFSIRKWRELFVFSK
jgi:O-antigen/teichoic acid export membrane protein